MVLDIPESLIRIMDVKDSMVKLGMVDNHNCSAIITMDRLDPIGQMVYGGNQK